MFRFGNGGHELRGRLVWQGMGICTEDFFRWIVGLAFTSAIRVMVTCLTVGLLEDEVDKNPQGL